LLQPHGQALPMHGNTLLQQQMALSAAASAAPSSGGSVPMVPLSSAGKAGAAGSTPASGASSPTAASSNGVSGAAAGASGSSNLLARGRLEMFCSCDSHVLVSIFVSPEYDKPGDAVASRIRQEFVTQFAEQLESHRIGEPDRIQSYPGGSEEALLDDSLLPVFAAFRQTLEQSGLLRVEPKAPDAAPVASPASSALPARLNHTNSGSQLTLDTGNGTSSGPGSPDISVAARNQRPQRAGNSGKGIGSLPLLTKDKNPTAAPAAPAAQPQSQSAYPYLGTSAPAASRVPGGSTGNGAAAFTDAGAPLGGVGSAPGEFQYGQGFGFGYGLGQGGDDFLPSWIADSSHDTSFLLLQGVPMPPPLLGHAGLLSPVPHLQHADSLYPAASDGPLSAADPSDAMHAAGAHGSDSSSPLVPSVSAGSAFSPEPARPSASPPAVAAQGETAPDDIQLTLE